MYQLALATCDAAVIRRSNLPRQMSPHDFQRQLASHQERIDREAKKHRRKKSR